MKPERILAWAALWLWGSTAWAAQSLGCLIEPDRIAEVGSQVIGVIESIRVERGDRVRKGQVLATLRAGVERASVNVAMMRAQAEADVRGAEANVEFVREKQRRTEALVKQNYTSQQALDQARTETRVAEERLAQAREQTGIWQRELELAQAQLELRSIRAPFNGIVADRYVWPGERVEEKALFKLAKVDPLRIEEVVPAAMFGAIRTGSTLNVSPELPNAGTLKARVVLVDRLVDSASNTFRARAELPNANGALPSGLRCKAELAQQGTAGATPPAARAAVVPAVSRSAEAPPEMYSSGLRLDPNVSLPKGTPAAPRRR